VKNARRRNFRGGSAAVAAKKDKNIEMASWEDIMPIQTLLKKTVTIATLAGSFMATAAWAETTITMNVWFPRTTYFYNDYMKVWADTVEEKSGGDIKVVIPAQSMAPPPGQLQLALDGVADVVMVINSYHRDQFHLQKIVEIPFTAETEEGAQVAAWRSYEELFAPAHEFKGVKVLGTALTAANSLQSSDHPLNSPSDLEGMKVRSDPGTAPWMEKFGAIPVVQPGNKSFELMSGGIVDGNLMTTEAVEALGYDRYVKHILEFPGGLSRFGFTFLMNEAKWNSLTPEQQQIVSDAAGENLSRALGKLLDERGRVIREQLIADGVTVNTAEGEALAAFQSELAFVREDWIAGADKKGVDGQAALDFFLETAQHPDE
jgi:TRAP-type C4-dicarboxylate transport system substrate-binding protein